MPEPGSEITYSIQGAELYPGKLKHQMGINEKHMDTAKRHTATKLDTDGKSNKNAILKTCPYKENATRKYHAWVTKQAQLTQSNERQTTEHMINARRALQSRLEQLAR